MSGLFKDEKYQGRSWGEIAFDFFEIFKDRFIYAVEKQRARTARKLIAAVLIAFGTIFFLNGLAVFIGELVGGSNWSGYLIVGVLLVIAGIFFDKKS
ncbi:MAG: hypothetical protein ACD_14C00022G0007 [uncultured bacterium]|nr:MAG: hypothetical protein ACD_14C00022G0007 [uncultured bacterium]